MTSATPAATPAAAPAAAPAADAAPPPKPPPHAPPPSHLISELRSFVINKPNWNLADLVKLVRRFHHEMSLLVDPEVTLPTVDSLKGYSRQHYDPQPGEPFIQKQFQTPITAGMVSSPKL